MIKEIANESNLQQAIAALKQTKAIQKEQLTGSFENKMQSLRPANLMKTAVAKTVTNFSVKKGLVLSGVGIIALFAVKKIFSRSSRGKGFLFAALTGAGSLIAKKVITDKLKSIVKL